MDQGRFQNAALYIVKRDSRGFGAGILSEQEKGLLLQLVTVIAPEKS